MERSLVHIESIKELNPIPDADRIVSAKVLGWNIVVKKDEFKVGDKVVYFEIDSVVDSANPYFAFLADRKFKVKSMRLRGALSQGLVAPLSILSNYSDRTEWAIGEDVTELTKTIKFEPPIPVQLQGQVKGSFPTHLISKTDELRVQSFPDVINELKGLNCYSSIKCDGTSLTFINDGTRRVCSRNIEFKVEENPDNLYVKMSQNINIPEGFAIQAEICGPGIQGNKMGLSEPKLFVFNVYNLSEHKYLDYGDFIDFCKHNGLTTVPILSVGTFDYTVEQLLEIVSSLKYDNGSPAEGVVIRPLTEIYSQVLKGRLSIKAISNEFLLKYKE